MIKYKNIMYVYQKRNTVESMKIGWQNRTCSKHTLIKYIKLIYELCIVWYNAHYCGLYIE